MTDALGDRCKGFESAYERVAMRGIPLLARLDGRAFHTFTRGLERPYDTRMQGCMRTTTIELVRQSHALVGYTQSDEITLLWHVESDSLSEYMFGGRVQKLASVLAGIASAAFARLADLMLPEKREQLPVFDCRVWQVPTKKDAVDVFVWREDDATKNSITMAASAYYSHKELDGKNSSHKHEMLHAKGVNWNDYPASFKRGSYVQRKSYRRTLSPLELADIPEKHRPASGQLVERHDVHEIEMPPIRRVRNQVGVVFERARPVVDDPRQTAMRDNFGIPGEP